MKTRFAATILMIVIMISSPLSAQAAAVTGEGMTDVLRYGPAAAAEKVSAQGRAAAFTSAGLKNGWNYRDGNCGAGCGATVGKLAGMATCMKTGMGSFAVRIGALQVGAVVALNALGDVFDWKTGRQVAGMLTEAQCEKIYMASLSSIFAGDDVKQQLWNKWVSMFAV